MGIIETIKMLEREEGIEEGMEKGMEKGVEIGMGKGLELGEEKKATQFVRNLLQTNQFSISQIAVLVGVAESFVLQVKKSLES